MLQIIREAVLNAMKHANASEIAVSCVTAPDGNHTVYIRDNGIGIGEPKEPEGHYGLNIMRERAERLGGTLTFSQPDEETFVCLKACKEAIRRGGLYPTMVNGANEAAVALFLDGKIAFTDIGDLVAEALKLEAEQAVTLSGIMDADRRARAFVLEQSGCGRK